ncbi:MAG TPA: hypothetical protein VF739_15890 [Ktedonobacterales bacterium]|jgi:hypothetical protein
MRKSTILVFWVGGLLFTVIGAILLIQTPLQEIEAPASLTLQSPLMIPVFLLLIAGVSNLIAWIGALILLIRLGAWGWVVAIIVLSGIGMLAFLVFGPDEYGPENDYDALADYGDYGSPV